MSFVEARNYALWVEHIHGNADLQKKIESMDPGELIEIEVEGVRSQWEKIVVPAVEGQRHGLRAAGEAQQHWHSLRNYRHGQLATLKDCS